MTVKDKNGKPVEGLTAKDFTITEDGVAQTISFCEFQKLDERRRHGTGETAGSSRRRLRLRPRRRPRQSRRFPGVTAHQITPERPGDIRYRDRRLMAMYFDMSAMPVPDQVRAETAAMKFIKTQMPPADLMAILAFNGAAVQVLQDFTDKKDDLETVINKLFIADSRAGRERQRRQHGRHRRGVRRGRQRVQPLHYRPAAWARCRPRSRCWASSTRRRCWCISPADCG